MHRLPIRILQFSHSHRRVCSRISRPLSTLSMATNSWSPNSYPPTHRSDHIDVYKSESKTEVRIADPYNWLEENTDGTDKWTSAQEAFTQAYLDKIPDRQRLEDAFRTSYNYPKVGSPTLEDDNRWYWYYNSGLQAQSVICRSKTLPDFNSGDDKTEHEIFFDPNLLSDDGTVSLTDSTISTCGKYFAYAISVSGSDANTIYVRSTDSPLATKDAVDGGRLPEEIHFVKFSSITWTHDSKGILYQRYPDRSKASEEGGVIQTQGDKNAMIYYHRIGTLQSEDILIHKDDANPDSMFHTDITDDGKYLLMYTSKDSSRRNLLWVADLAENEIGPNIKWITIVNVYEAEYYLIGNKGPLLYIRTNKGAPNRKLITVDLSKQCEVKGLIPEDKDASLDSISVVDGDKFALIYKRNVKDEIYIYSNEGIQLTHLAPNFVGTASINSREKQSWFFVTMIGFNTPGTIAQYKFENPEEQRWNIYRKTKVNELNPEDFEAQQVWYESKDGTKIPMFIVRHKTTPFDGTAPAIQYGYGGFNISINPSFNPILLTFLKTYGAILAIPNIRGGGEFGETWHKGAVKEKKSNCFDDFICATEYLVKNKYAAPGKVAINGGSNGGLLVAACVHRAPEGTFGAAVAEVGVMDMLKFSKFTIGKAWTSDYGDPEDPHDFDFIYPISPLHNIPKDRILPPFLLLTADHDDRVVPMHSFKYAAALQHTLAHNPNPLLIRIDKKSGHGAGKSTEKRIQEAADKWGFVAYALGLKWKDTSVQPNL